MEGEGEKKKRRRRDRRNRERETEGEGLRVRKHVASGRAAPRRSREERACAPVLSGAHLSVSPGTCTRRIGTHFCVCARIYDGSYGIHPWRTFGAGEPGPENWRGGENDATQRARMKGRVFSGKGQRYRPRNGNVASEGRCLATS